MFKYKLLVREFVGSKKADQTLGISGSWECVFFDKDEMGKNRRIYGYCRVCSKKQNIERQIRNIQDVYPDAIIAKEVFNRTSFYGRIQWNKEIRSPRLPCSNSYLVSGAERYLSGKKAPGIFHQYYM